MSDPLREDLAREAWRQQLVRVGVAVLLWRRVSVSSESVLQLLMGLRRGSHGAGTWSLPGGHLEVNETVQSCAEREVLEETGLVARCASTDQYVVTHIEGRTYVTLYAEGHVDADAVPRLVEPDKCFEWRWVRRWASVSGAPRPWPGPLFPPFKDYCDKYLPGGA